MPTPEPTRISPEEAHRLLRLMPDGPGPDPGELGRRVRAAREAAGLTQAEVAAWLGRPNYQAVGHWEASGTRLAYADLIGLLRLGLDPVILCPELMGE